MLVMLEITRNVPNIAYYSLSFLLNDWFAMAFGYSGSIEMIDAIMVTIRLMVEGYFEANYSL